MVVSLVDVKVATKGVWTDVLMGENWDDATVDWMVVRLVDRMDASMVERLAVCWADSTVAKMALLPVVWMVVHWVVRWVDVKDKMKVAWMEVLMVAS